MVSPVSLPCRDYKKIASNYDLVVTTYQTLASDYSRQGKTELFEPLGKIHWVSRVRAGACAWRRCAGSAQAVCRRL